MSLGTAIYTFLSDALDHQRVYPLTLPQGVTLPAYTYQLISELPLNSHSEAQGSETFPERKYRRVRLQFGIYGTSYSQMEDAASELEELLGGYRGAWGDIDVGSAFLDVALDDYEPDTRTWRRIQDVVLQYQADRGS